MSVIIGGDLAAIVIIAAMMCWRGCLSDGKCIVASGLVLWNVSLGIEQLVPRIFAGGTEKVRETIATHE